MPSLLLPPPFSFINTTLIPFLSLFFIFLIPTYATSDDEGYKACAPFSCGNFTNIGYPFWSNDQPAYCGHPKFKLDCQQHNVTIDINSQKFRIIDINQNSQLLKIARLDLWVGNTSCPNQYINVSLDLGFFNYTSNDENHTLLYDCGSIPDSYTSNSPLSSEVSGMSTCLIDGDQQPHGVYLVPSTKVVDFNVLGCKNNITVPVLKSFLNNDNYLIKVNVSYVLSEGFEVGWSGVDGEKCDGCLKSGGRCGYNASENGFMCLCPNQEAKCGFCNLNPTDKILLNELDGCRRSKLNKFPALSPLPAPPPTNGLPSYSWELPPPSQPPLPYAPYSQDSHDVKAKGMYSSFS